MQNMNWKRVRFAFLVTLGACLPLFGNTALHTVPEPILDTAALKALFNGVWVGDTYTTPDTTPTLQDSRIRWYLPGDTPVPSGVTKEQNGTPPEARSTSFVMKDFGPVVNGAYFFGQREVAGNPTGTAGSGGNPGWVNRMTAGWVFKTFTPTSIAVNPSTTDVGATTFWTNTAMVVKTWGGYSVNSAVSAPIAQLNIPAPINGGEYFAVDTEYEIFLGLAKSNSVSRSVDTRLAYGNPLSTGELKPDPNALEGYLSFSPYEYKGGLFSGFVGGNTKDQSGTSWLHCAMPALTVPTALNASDPQLVGRTMQLYCAESAPGYDGLNLHLLPYEMTSTYASSMISSPSIRWDTRFSDLPTITEPLLVNVGKHRRSYSFGLVGAGQSLSASGVVLVPQESVTTYIGGEPTTSSQTPQWRYFVQEGKTPRIPAPSGQVTEPRDYSVWIRKVEVKRMTFYAKYSVQDLDPNTPGDQPGWVTYAHAEYLRP